MTKMRRAGQGASRRYLATADTGAKWILSGSLLAGRHPRRVRPCQLELPEAAAVAHALGPLASCSRGLVIFADRAWSHAPGRNSWKDGAMVNTLNRLGMGRPVTGRHLRPHQGHRAYHHCSLGDCGLLPQSNLVSALAPGAGVPERRASGFSHSSPGPRTSCP